MTIRAVRSVGGSVAVDQVDLRGPEDWPVVHVAAAGICGSDLHLVAGGPSQFTLGHEFSGHLDDGTPVGVMPLLTCGECLHCASGHPQRCHRAATDLFGIAFDGGMSDQVRVHPSCIRRLPDGLDVEAACLAGPLAVALHGLHRAGVEPGDRVLVVGAGTIGLCAVEAALALDATVDVAELDDVRRGRANALGAQTETGKDYQVVVDAAGTQGALDLAVGRAAHGGTGSVLACYWSPVKIGFEPQLREVSLVPGFLYGVHDGEDEYDQALRILVGSTLPEVAITHRFELVQASEAFEVAATPAAGKVLLVP